MPKSMILVFFVIAASAAPDAIAVTAVSNRAGTPPECGHLKLSVERGLFTRGNILQRPRRTGLVVSWDERSRGVCAFETGEPRPRKALTRLGKVLRVIRGETFVLKRIDQEEPVVRALPFTALMPLFDAADPWKKPLEPARPHVLRRRRADHLETFRYGRSRPFGDAFVPTSWTVIKTDGRRKSTAKIVVVEAQSSCDIARKHLETCSATEPPAGRPASKPVHLEGDLTRRGQQSRYFSTADYLELRREGGGGTPAPRNVGPAGLPVWIWHRGLSQVDGAKCPHFPTCSQYAAMSLRKHGPFGGAIRTISRLLDENDDVESQGFHRFALVYGRWRLHDPVD